MHVVRVAIGRPCIGPRAVVDNPTDVAPRALAPRLHRVTHLMKEAIYPNEGGNRSSGTISRASAGSPSSAVISRASAGSPSSTVISNASAAHLQRPIARRVKHLKDLLEALEAAVLQLGTRDAHHAPLWKQLQLAEELRVESCVERLACGEGRRTPWWALACWAGGVFTGAGVAREEHWGGAVVSTCMLGGRYLPVPGLPVRTIERGFCFGSSPRSRSSATASVSSCACLLRSSRPTRRLMATRAGGSPTRISDAPDASAEAATAFMFTTCRCHGTVLVITAAAGAAHAVAAGCADTPTTTPTRPAPPPDQPRTGPMPQPTRSSRVRPNRWTGP